MTATLRTLLCEWESWATHADRSEDGWQSGFPAWDGLMAAAEAMMTHPSPSEEDVKDLARCWAISEETEDLADFARDHLDACWDALERLARVANSAVRWQVYDVLGSDGRRAVPLLRAALDDADPYARRRAILSLARLQPPDAKQLAQRFADDADPYIRKAALELARS